MTTPPKYEDLVLKVAELERSEAALREELATLRESYESMRDRKNSIVDLQQRLTVTEQRAGELDGLLRKAKQFVEAWNDDSQEWMDLSSDISNSIPCDSSAAIKPAADGEGS